MESLKEAVHESRSSETVIEFIPHEKLNKRTLEEMNNGTIVGLYKTNSCNVRGHNVWNETFPATK